MKETPQIPTILSVVSQFYDCEIETILSDTRLSAIVQIRQVAMYLAHKHTGESFSRIGQCVGQRGHATVIHACKTVSNQCDVNKRFREEIELLDKKVLQVLTVQ